jgi:hypothetical protein
MPHVKRPLTVLVILSLAFAALSLPAYAHNPIFEETDTSSYSNALLIPDPDISYAHYGFLDSTYDIDYYYFDLKGKLNVSSQLNVPKNVKYEDFYPTYVIIGPGIDYRPEGLPFELPDGYGALAFDTGTMGSRDEFYEPFSGITYYRSPKNYTTFETPGRYYIVVYDKEQKKGDYVIAVGDKESFSIWDIPRVIIAVIKLRLGWLDNSSKV